MKTLHRAMMTVALTAVLALAAGVLLPSAEAVQAQPALPQHGAPQHGENSDPAAQFAAIAEGLELSPTQREALETPIVDTIGKLQELAQLHGTIAAGLNDVQQEKFAAAMLNGATQIFGAGGGHGHSGH